MAPRQNPCQRPTLAVRQVETCATCWCVGPATWQCRSRLLRQLSCFGSPLSRALSFREAYQWVHQAGARLVADAGCGYGGFAVFVARQDPTLSVDGYTLSDVQQAVARQALARLHQ